MIKKIVALIIFEESEDRKQQSHNIKKHIKNSIQMELVGMIELPYTYLPHDMEVTLDAVKKIGIDTIMIDAGIIASNLIDELHNYVSDQQLELVEINKKIIQFKRFLMILPDERNNEGLQIQNAIIKYSKLESTKEVMDIVSIATEFSVIEIIILSNQDTKWIQNAYLYKLHRIATILNINVCLASNLENYYDK